MANHQIFPRLGEIKIQALTPAILDVWIRGLQQAGLAQNTIRHTRTLLSQALHYAVYPSQLIPANPTDYIKIPKNAPKNIIKRSIITPERFKKLLGKYSCETDYYIPLLILYHTGVRCGELLGLTWDAIDFEKRTITIDKQIVHLRLGYFFSTPKTQTSCRVIVADEILIEELKRWRERQNQNEKESGDSYVHVYCRDSDRKLIQQSKSLGVVNNAQLQHIVCTRKTGKATLPFHIGHLLKKEGLNAHSFRHTHATLLIESGATPKGVAGRLGHSGVAITQNLYTHITERMNEETASIFGRIMQTSN